MRDSLCKDCVRSCKDDRKVVVCPNHKTKGDDE